MQQTLTAFRLTISASIADYTIDCWPNDIGIDPPECIGLSKDRKRAAFAITDIRQLKEFRDQADQQVDMYQCQGCYDSSERADYARWKRALATAQSALDAFDKAVSA